MRMCPEKKVLPSKVSNFEDESDNVRPLSLSLLFFFGKVQTNNVISSHLSCHYPFFRSLKDGKKVKKKKPEKDKEEPDQEKEKEKEPKAEPKKKAKSAPKKKKSKSLIFTEIEYWNGVLLYSFGAPFEWTSDDPFELQHPHLFIYLVITE